jgi:hypothetical protein
MYGTARRGSSGAELRFYSNCRAYLDIGFSVDVVQVLTETDSYPTEPELPVKSTVVRAPAMPASLAGRLMYRCGYPGSAAAAYYFEKHATVLRAARIRVAQYPGSLHQFENHCESPIPFLHGIRSIWSCHDLLHTVAEGSQRIDQENESRGSTRAERREVRFTRQLERRVAKSSGLILCVSQVDCDEVRSWGCRTAEVMPLSIPHVPERVDRPEWRRGGKLKLMHMGAIAHLPTYRSLEFLLGEVFPRLKPGVLDQISLEVIGNIVEGERCGRILSLSSRYPNVSLLGRIPDLEPHYASADVQVVASTDATGLRTRIVESFALGLPVLSSWNACRGVAGVRPGENLLLANTPEEWAAALESLVRDPGPLPILARQARETYDTVHGAPVVAASLAAALERHLGVLPPGRTDTNR